MSKKDQTVNSKEDNKEKTDLPLTNVKTTTDDIGKISDDDCKEDDMADQKENIEDEKALEKDMFDITQMA